MSRARDPKPELSPKELEGFVQLLCGTHGPPEPTEQIIAYIERIAGEKQIDDKVAKRIADETIRSILEARLRSASIEPVRSFDFHLKAKRDAAHCTMDQVAYLLKVDSKAYEQIESGERNPLEESAKMLASIVAIFGLHMKEFRDSLVGYVERGRPPVQLRFARGAKERISKEQFAIAAEDLRRAGKSQISIDAEMLAKIDKKVGDVAALLPDHQRGAI